MIKNKPTPLLLKVLLILVTAVLIFMFLVLRASNQARKARFNVDVLQRYIRALEIVEKKEIKNLSELPDFHIISTYDSLSITGEDLKKGIVDGYVYDMSPWGSGGYVISASPIGLLRPNLEFGITEDGILRMNDRNVDLMPDDYDEVTKWEKIPRSEQVRTAELPDYLKE